MNHVLQIFSTYMAELTFGSALLLPFFPNRVTGKSFPRFYYGMIVCFFLLLLFCQYRIGHLNWNIVPLLGLCLLAFGMTLAKNVLPFENYLNHMLGGLSALWYFVFVKNIWFPQHAWTENVFVLIGFALSAVYLSLHLMTMIFGHWYLVNRKLPIQHLISVCRVLFIITTVRTLASLGVTIAAATAKDTQVWQSLTDLFAHGIFFYGRFFAGLGVPALVSVLAYKSAKIGSNQSATGILYAGVVFVLMGEFLALYLYALTGYFF